MKHRARFAGFTLIEVLVAIALLATAGGALLAAQGSGGRLLRKTLEIETATRLAHARLAEASLFPDRPPPPDAREDQFEGRDFVTRIEYRTVSPLAEISVDDLPEPMRLIEIRVIVRWGEEGRERVQLSAYHPLPASAQTKKADGK